MSKEGDMVQEVFSSKPSAEKWTRDSRLFHAWAPATLHWKVHNGCITRARIYHYWERVCVCQRKVSLIDQKDSTRMDDVLANSCLRKLAGLV